MPSTYAHYRFGLEVLYTLPEHLKKTIEPYQELFHIGLHGPDILFYYKPLSLNRVNQTGFGMHEEPAIRFFQNSGEVIVQQKEPGPYLAYIYGFLCHFALDSECHGYIDEKIEESRISHTEIEVEFDRDLMCEDGFYPITHPLTDHILPKTEYADIIAPFFDGITRDQILKALKSMKSYNKLLIAPHRMKRYFIYALLAVSGNYKEMHGLIVNYKPNPKCDDSTKKLKRLYGNAVFQANKLIQEYKECAFGGKCLDRRYRLTFGSREPAASDIGDGAYSVEAIK